MCAQVTELRMKLSDRMQVIADHVAPGEIAADIGTDHGQIPVWLFAKGISPRVILSDISAASLAKAKETAAAYQFGSGLSFRVGDGLSVLRPGEADTVIIAGMGGKLIRQILAEDLSHTLSFHKFILQPRKGYGLLRKWLLEQGFLFVGEDIVRENRYLPEIMTVVRPYAPGDPVVEDLATGERAQLMALDEDDIRVRVPRWMCRAAGPLEDYFALRIGQEELKLENMQRAKQRDAAVEAQVRENIAYLEGLAGALYVPR